MMEKCTNMGRTFNILEKKKTLKWARLQNQKNKYNRGLVEKVFVKKLKFSFW